MNAQHGLSTLTIIVTLTVLLVLAAIAIPTWHNHQVRSRVDEALKATDAAKLVVMEAAAIHGSLSDIKASELGYSSAAVTDPYVAHIGIGDGGRIRLVTRNTGAPKDPVLLLIPSKGKGDRATSPITWSCAMTAGDPAVAPAGCHVERADGTHTMEPAKPTTTGITPSAGSP